MHAGPPRQVTQVEGITEYRLDNGMQVLLFPDSSKPVVTVNLTLFVGSRHEGYGEAGMAHLLEHMLFKGTPNHREIPKLLNKRGADFNGTTWLDRTNYYETLPAEGDNLEFAIRLEADRMINSYIKGEDLVSEMTVVRNEFESGEDLPAEVLSERIYATAYRWHNYGQTTIGNQSDIERVPIDRLQAFYRKYYRPDNAMLIVAGVFDPQATLELIEKYFGILENPATPLPAAYTQEPPQDGERTTILRRVANSQHVGVAYHVPAGSHEDFAPLTIWTSILGTEPSGRLYQKLIETKLASSVQGEATGQHDPGLALFRAEVPRNQSVDVARDAMIEVLEGIDTSPVTQSEVDRGIAEYMKARELLDSDSKVLATVLSEWAAQGDWRLYFLFRDRIEQVTAEQVQAVAKKYFVRNNRTVGMFLPTEEAERIAIPANPDLTKMLADYQGREAMADGEALDNDLNAIQQRVEEGTLASGVRYAMLNKKCRGEMVHLLLSLRFGDEATLKNRRLACSFLGAWLRRGTKELDFQNLQDRLSELRSTIQCSSQPGLLQIQVAARKKQLQPTLDVLRQILREPRWDTDELETMRTELLTSLESQAKDPQALAPLAVSRALNPYPKGDARYIGSLDEQIEELKKLSAKDIQAIYQQLLGGTFGELVIVGDVEVESMTAPLDAMLAGWKGQVPYQRMATQSKMDMQGTLMTIETPDKSNSVFFASQPFAMRDSDADYAALAIGNYILGGGSLSSRLADRVRQQDGLSYGIGSGFNAHPIDPRGSLSLYAIANPENQTKLLVAIEEEVTRIVRDGITTEELQVAKEGFVQTMLVERSGDLEMASLLASNLFAKRNLDYQVQLEKQIAELTVEQVNQVLKKYIQYGRFMKATAGDFEGKLAKPKE